MGNTWRSKVQYQKLSRELSGAEGLQFEREILPYLRLIFPTVMQAQAQASLDTGGIDLAVPGPRAGAFRLGIQCKGFRVTDAEIGRSQIKQCLHSIERFSAQSFPVEEYWLVHNRTGKLEAFRGAISGALAALVQNGRVKTARLIDREDFLDEILDPLFKRFRRFVFERARNSSKSARSMGVPDAPLEVVPFTVQGVRVSKSDFKEATAISNFFGDPVSHLSASGGDSESHMKLVMGEFGMGKTTLAFRLAARRGFSSLYVSAASFPLKVSGTKELSTYFCGAWEFVAAFAADQQEILEGLTRLMSHKLLSQNDNRLILVIDGLDESPFLTTGNGLPVLFDTLSGLRARAILTMRTEFWRTRSESLLAGYVARSPPTKLSVRNRQLSMLELLPWSNPQILLLVTQAQNAAPDEKSRGNLEALEQTVATETYHLLYGDIPTRPLFLRILCDFVAEFGLGEVTLADLFRDWIDMKIRRDFMDPVAQGGPGRSGIRSDAESADVRRKVAILAMEAASALMTAEQGGKLMLLPDCDFTQLTESIPSLRGEADMAGLVLNSLLVPIRRHGEVSALRFSHQAFQEYFLARAIVEKGAFDRVSLPAEVEDWCRRLRRETSISGF